MRYRWIWMWMAGMLVAGGDASAQVRVVKGAGQKVGLDWSGLRAAPSPGAAAFRQVLTDDLSRSGWFAPAPAGQGQVALQGQCDESGGSLAVEIRVVEVAGARSLLSKRYPAPSVEARRLAHKVADEIVEAVTGRKGMASARMVIVGNRTRVKELYLCDADGTGLMQLTQDRSINLAPRWSPDGRTITYTSYLMKYPDVYTIDVASGARNRVSKYPGLNTGGALSPSGREMALVLSKDGNPELYIRNMSGGQLTRLTTTPRAAEACPSWSPDGQRIVFVSDQPGTPQLYVVGRDGGRPMRLTSRGIENVAPCWGRNGWIAFASRQGARYVLCLVHPDTLEWKQITEADADYEDPSWAPNGRHLACSRTANYRSAIYLIDTLGDPPVKLIDSNGDWFSPSWSP